MRLVKRFRPSPAMVIGCLALLLTLGGTGYAASQALPRNSVTTIQVKDHSLLARDFKARDLTWTCNTALSVEGSTPTTFALKCSLLEKLT